MPSALGGSLVPVALPCGRGAPSLPYMEAQWGFLLSVTWHETLSLPSAPCASSPSSSVQACPYLRALPLTAKKAICTDPLVCSPRRVWRHFTH